MNRNELQGTWKEVKGKIKQQWGKVTDDELNKINGQYEALCGSLQRHYGYTKEEAEKHVNKFLEGQSSAISQNH